MRWFIPRVFSPQRRPMARLPKPEKTPPPSPVKAG